ncbi:MAG TPA: hypothetical protein VFZ78_11725 [Flavisolibacter sp.]
MGISVLTAACNNASEDVVQNFQQVDASLQHSNVTMAASIENLRRSIDSARASFPRIVAGMDTVISRYHTLQRFIRHHQEQLKLQSPDAMPPAGGLIIPGNASDSLYRHVLTLLHSCRNRVTGEDSKKDLDFLIERMFLHKDPEHWRNEWFQGTPAMAAITLLSKIRNDCELAVHITLLEMQGMIRGKS